VALLAPLVLALQEQPRKELDPTAWGSDHVGKPLPEYTTGEECLFCHREGVGTSWGDNRHNLTMRPASPDEPALAALRQRPALRPFADETAWLLGGRRQTRFLKPAAQYGHADLLRDRDDPPRWDHTTFADACAGCHATAVEANSRAFAAVSLDCYTCHGVVPADHTSKPGSVLLAGENHTPARVVASICGQCHARGGRSRSSGLPYPNQFVAGDNLFRDFQLDLSETALARLEPAEAHVLENLRQVVLLGNDQITCLSCHDLHGRSSRKHQRLDETVACQTCHRPGEPPRLWRSGGPRNATCQY
jgi:hypothetical protein